jgi:PAS domain S-box-containing protein
VGGNESKNRPQPAEQQPAVSIFPQEPDAFRAGLACPATVGTWLWDIVADSVRGDHNLNRMFGITAATAQAHPIADYLQAIHLEDRAAVWGAISHAIADEGGEFYEAEYRLVTGGAVRWVHAQGVVRRNATGAATDMSGVLRDVSEQRSEEQRRRALLAEAEAKVRVFDTTLSAIADFAYILDLDGRFRYVNKALLDLWGLTLQEAVGKNFFDLGYPEDLAARLQRQLQQVIATRSPLVDETRYVSRTGVDGYYEYIFAPVFAADGTVQVVAGSTRDITARKRNQDALIAKTEQFEALFNDVPLAVYLVDAEFRLRAVNPGAAPVFANIPDAIGRDFTEVIHALWCAPFADELIGLFKHTLETGEAYYAAERRGERKDIHRTEIYEWQINRIRLPDGQYGAAAYFREISAQVQARLELEAADQRKNEFLAMLAHELRSPLAPILYSGEILSRVANLDDVAGRAVGIIKRQASLLARLVDDLLDISRISLGRIELKAETFDLSCAIEQALETVSPLLNEKHHEIQVHHCPEPLFVKGDRVRLAQCIANILTNAAKYTDPGGRIQVHSSERGSWAIIAVTDNGIGIAPELKGRLFDLFVQGDHTEQQTQGGLGIGLSLVKRLLQLHGGDIVVTETGVQVGSTFEIRLPRVRTVPSADF